MAGQPQHIVDEALAVFKEACDTFESQLSVEERKKFIKFTDGQAMLTDVKAQFEADKIHRSTLTKSLRQVNKATEKIAPLFSIIDIFVQSHPEYAGIAWGAIRLVFHLGSNYTMFLKQFAEMYQKLAFRLPAYEDTIKKSNKYRPLNPRLLKSLAFIYSDIIQFCYDACRLFSPKQGTRSRTRTIWTLLWKPFDVRFADLLERFDQHTQLFDVEMNVTEMNVMIHHHESFEEEVKRNHEQRGKDDVAFRKQEEDMHQRCLKDIRDWINAPSWKERYEETLRDTEPGTSDWLRNDPQYQGWFQALISAWKRGERHDRNVLFIEGKPGFGKTFLSANLVYHLQSYSKNHPVNMVNGQRNNIFVPYYFFDKQQPSGTEMDSAIRAILAQIIHNFREDRDGIDFASFLLYDASGGQRKATLGETVSLLEWYLRRYSNILVVVDGLDEADYPTRFLRHLGLIRHNALSVGVPMAQLSSELAMIIFTRPKINLPRSVSGKLVRLSLQGSQNSEDLETFLTPRIIELIDAGFIDSAIDPLEIVRNTIRHANGMFLWTSLLMDYLQSPALSPKEKADALDNLLILEGLESLFTAILAKLGESLPANAANNVNIAFQAVASAKRPLSVHELRIVICLLKGEKPSEQTMMPQMEESLGQISGALLELSPAGHVRFIHTSAMEYLFECSTKSSVPHPFGIDRESQPLFAAACLFYLLECIPSEPLSGSAEESPDRALVCRKYLFLEYALEFWVFHLCTTVEMFVQSVSSSSRTPIPQELYQKIGSYTQKFFTDSNHLRFWIEASWLFNTHINLSNLVDQIGNPTWSTLVHSRSLLLKLREIDTGLACLKAQWDHVLFERPNEIWDTSVTALTDSLSWLTSKECSTMNMKPAVELHPDELSIFLDSELSSDGSELALLRLIIPRKTLTGASARECERIDRQEWARIYSQGWLVHFEIWSLDRKVLLLEDQVDLEQEVVEPLLAGIPSGAPRSVGSDDSLYFPWIPDASISVVRAISADLRHVFVQGTLITVHRTAPHLGSASGYGTVKSKYYDYRCTGDSRQVGQLLAVSFGPSNDDLLIIRLISGHGNQELQAIVSKGISGSNDPEVRLWFRIEDSSFHQRLTNLTLGIREYAFHPHLPILAIPNVNDTYFICFARMHLRPIQAFSGVLEEPEFSSCGNFILGAQDGKKRVIDVRNAVQSALSQGGAEHPSASESSLTNSTEDDRQVKLEDLVSTQTSAVQLRADDTMVFQRDERGIAAISILRQFQEGGALILHTLAEDGVIRSESISRIPQRLLNSEARLVRSPKLNQSGLTRVVFSARKKPDIRFVYDARPEVDIPVVLDRMNTTIRSQTRTALKTLESPGHIDLQRILDQWDLDPSEEKIQRESSSRVYEEP